MTHLAWQEVAQGCQQRHEARCEAEGHNWERFESGAACRWCLALSDSDKPEGPVNWRARAVYLAVVVRSWLSVKEPLDPLSAGAGWLAEAKETLRLADAEKAPIL